MSQEKEEYIRLINSNIKQIVTDIVLLLECEHSKKEELNSSLSFLANIVEVYSKENEMIFAQCLTRLNQIKYLYQFEIDVLVKELWERLFSQIHVFKEAYEISVLKIDQPKYHHLKVEEPLIQINIPKPYLCQPLSQAQFIGEAKIVSVEGDEETQQRFT